MNTGSSRWDNRVPPLFGAWQVTSLSSLVDVGADREGEGVEGETRTLHPPEWRIVRYPIGVSLYKCGWD